MKEKIALFDFCETLANFQTADPYVDFVRQNHSNPRMKFWHFFHKIAIKLKIVSILYRLFPDSSPNKRFILKQLSGLSYDVLEKDAQCYYEMQIKPNLIPRIISELKALKEEGYRIMLVSGGYNLYLKFFARDFGIHQDDIESTIIDFDSRNRCKGTFKGKDCLGNEKLKRLNHRFPEREGLFFYAYSDSESDMPFLKWADKGFVVRNVNTPKWDNNNLFGEILWQ